MVAVETFTPRGDTFFRPGMAPTSRDAYASVQPALSAMQARIYNYVHAVGNATMEEMEIGLSLRHQTLGPLALRLRGDGLLVALRDGNGAPVKRETRSGRKAIVYRAVRAEGAKPRDDVRPNKWQKVIMEAITDLEEGYPIVARIRLKKALAR